MKLSCSRAVLLLSFYRSYSLLVHNPRWNLTLKRQQEYNNGSSLLLVWPLQAPAAARTHAGQSARLLLSTSGLRPGLRLVNRGDATLHAGQTGRQVLSEFRVKRRKVLRCRLKVEDPSGKRAAQIYGGGGACLVYCVLFPGVCFATDVGNMFI